MSSNNAQSSLKSFALVAGLAIVGCGFLFMWQESKRHTDKSEAIRGITMAMNDNSFESLSIDEVAALFDDADLDNNGRLDVEEFNRLLINIWTAQRDSIKLNSKRKFDDAVKVCVETNALHSTDIATLRQNMTFPPSLLHAEKMIIDLKKGDALAKRLMARLHPDGDGFISKDRFLHLAPQLILKSLGFEATHEEIVEALNVGMDHLFHHVYSAHK